MPIRKRIAEGTIKDLRFEMHPGEYAARFSGALHCAELEGESIPLEIHFEEPAALAHQEGVRLEYRTKRWYFFEDEFHLFLPVRLQPFFENLCFEAARTDELIEPVLFFALENGAIANLQGEARLAFPMGESFLVEFSPR